MTVLYKNITLSIEPNTYSPEMFSWFPIFFPLKVCRNIILRLEEKNNDNDIKVFTHAGASIFESTGPISGSFLAKM